MPAQPSVHRLFCEPKEPLNHVLHRCRHRLWCHDALGRRRRHDVDQRCQGHPGRARPDLRLGRGTADPDRRRGRRGPRDPDRAGRGPQDGPLHPARCRRRPGGLAARRLRAGRREPRRPHPSCRVCRDRHRRPAHPGRPVGHPEGEGPPPGEPLHHPQTDGQRAGRHHWPEGAGPGRHPHPRLRLCLRQRGHRPGSGHHPVRPGRRRHRRWCRRRDPPAAGRRLRPDAGAVAP